MNISQYQLAKIYILLSGILFSSIGFLGINITNSGIDLKLMLFWRFFISTFFLLACLRKIPTFMKNIQSFLLGSILYAPSTYLWFSSVKIIGSGLAMVIFYSFPVYVVLLSYLINKENFTKIKLTALITMVSGLILLADFNNSSIDLLGLVLAITSAIIYGIYFFFSKKLTKNINYIESSTIICLGNSFVFFILSIKLFNFNYQSIINNTVYFNMILIAIFGTALPILLLFKSLKYISETEAAILSVSEPVFSLIIGVFILDEHINLSQYIGIIFIILSSIIVQFETSKI